MNSQKYYIYLTDGERSLTIQCLVDLRNALLLDGKYTDAVDELIHKISRARRKRL